MKHLFTLLFAVVLTAAHANQFSLGDLGTYTVCGESPCVGFTNNTPDIVSWFWDFGDTASGPANYSTSQTTMHCYSSVGTYTVTLTVINIYGDTGTGSGMVHNLVNPTSSFTHTNLGGNAVQFTDQSFANIAAWDWDFGDASPHSNAQNPTHQYASSGTYTVQLQVVNFDGCMGTLSLPVTATPTGIASPGNNFFVSLFPNPASNELTIDLPPSSALATIEFFNAAGQLLLREETGNHFTMDISSFAPGVYFVAIQQNENHLRQKLVILR